MAKATRFVLLCACALLVSSCHARIAAVPSARGDMSIVNGRYLADASGRPLFLIGTYDSWVSPDNTWTADKWRNQWVITDSVALHGLNFAKQAIDYPNHYGHTTYPYAITGGKFRLDSYDASWWSKFRDLVRHRANLGIVQEIGFFEGCGLWDKHYSYPKSPWNVANHYSSYYSGIDLDSDGRVDESGEFYDLAAFESGTGIGYHQKRLIRKIVTETSDLPNVYYAVGNEIGTAPAAWYNAVLAYARSLTNKPVGINPCYSGVSCDSFIPSVASPGFVAGHESDTPAEVKAAVASRAGKGYPYFDDPDGSDLMDGSPDDLRRAAWYALTGGAAGWLGYHEGDGARMPMEALRYYQYLLQFLDRQAVRFWEMTPRHSLVSNDAENSLLADPGSAYLAFVLADPFASVTLDERTYEARFFNPADNTTTAGEDVSGPGARTFPRPSGAGDWVLYLRKKGAPGAP